MTETYRRWVVGKRCRPHNLSISTEPLEVADVKFMGPPSAVYGFAVVTYVNEKIDYVVGDGHKPTKKDFRICEEGEAQ